MAKNMLLLFFPLRTSSFFLLIKKKNTIVFIQMADVRRNKGSQYLIHNSKILRALKNSLKKKKSLGQHVCSKT